MYHTWCQFVFMGSIAPQLPSTPGPQEETCTPAPCSSSPPYFRGVERQLSLAHSLEAAIDHEVGKPSGQVIRVVPTLIDVGFEMRGPVTFTVKGLQFLNTSKYSCSIASPYGAGATLSARVDRDRLLCVWQGRHLVNPFNGGMSIFPMSFPFASATRAQSQGGSVRFRVSKTRAGGTGVHVVHETTVFVVRGGAYPGEHPEITAEKAQLSKDFQRYIEVVQNPPSCTNASVFIMRKLWTTGLGSQVLMVSQLLLETLRKGVVLVDGLQDWNYAESAPERSWAAVFQPLSKCDLQLVSDTRSAQQVPMEMDPSRFGGQFFGAPANWTEGLPPEFTQFGIAWVIGQLFLYTTRPNPTMQGYIQQAQQALPPAKPFVCVHVRQGERGTKAPKSDRLPPMDMQKWDPQEVMDILVAFPNPKRYFVTSPYSRSRRARHRAPRRCHGAF